jgi:hypothetical protein
MFTDVLSTMLESAEYESQKNQIRSKVFSNREAGAKG